MASLLRLQRTLEAPLLPFYLWSELRLPLGQFSTAKTGRGGAMCSEEDLMMSERLREGGRGEKKGGGGGTRASNQAFGQWRVM